MRFVIDYNFIVSCHSIDLVSPDQHNIFGVISLKKLYKV